MKQQKHSFFDFVFVFFFGSSRTIWRPNSRTHLALIYNGIKQACSILRLLLLLIFSTTTTIKAAHTRNRFTLVFFALFFSFIRWKQNLKTKNDTGRSISRPDSSRYYRVYVRVCVYKKSENYLRPRAQKKLTKLK